MKIESLILNKLLDKFEKSSHYRGTSLSNRRVIIKLGSRSLDLKEYDIENYDKKMQIHSAVTHLSEKNLIGYKWERAEEGNILAEIWLSLEQVDSAYRELGRIPKKDVVNDILYQIQQILSSSPNPPINSDAGSWILPALEEIYNSSKASLSISSALPADYELAGAFLKALNDLSRPNFPEISIRAFSLSCFHDSKYLEKNLLSRLLSFVRNQCSNFRDIPAEEAVPEIELLEAVNLYRNPEIYEFCGAVHIVFQVDFQASHLNTYLTVDYGIFGRGAALHSGSLSDVISMDAPEISKVLFIENRTNYEDYIAGKRASDELVIYHGGFHNKKKADFFRFLVNAVPSTAKVYHWGDIDLGGMKIFMQIQKDIAPNLVPYRMDSQTLLAMENYGISYSQAYRNQLLKAVEISEFLQFSELIQVMLETGLRLEQEAFLMEKI